jgi:hypothetical protein
MPSQGVARKAMAFSPLVDLHQRTPGGSGEEAAKQQLRAALGLCNPGPQFTTTHIELRFTNPLARMGHPVAAGGGRPCSAADF